jgi:hypothetical protein
MVSFGLFRRAVREPTYRTVPSTGPTSPPITPILTFRKAICTYHRAGRQTALDEISLPSPYWRTNPRGKTLARNYRESLETYFSLDVADGRRTYDVGVKQSLAIAGEVLSIYMDALVYATTAHTARIALWDVPMPSRYEASVMALPIIEALQAAVGDERARSVAFWHLRSATIIEVGRAEALSRAADASDAVRRAAGP